MIKTLKDKLYSFFAGGELIIPTLILLFGIDIKLAGSLSLAISLPTMITGLIRYKKDNSFNVVYSHKSFILIMAMGSILGAFIGGLMVGIISDNILIPLLSIILLLSSYKICVINNIQIYFYCK